MHSQAIWAYIHQFSNHLALKPASRLFYYAASQVALRTFRTDELHAESLLFSAETSEASKALRFSLKLIDKLLEKTAMPQDLNKTMQLSYSSHPKKRYGLYQFLILKSLREKLECHLTGTEHILCLSLSACEDDTAQWASCSAGGAYALGFSSEHLAEQATEQHFSLLPCYYSSASEQKLVVQGALLGGLQAWFAKVQALYEAEPDLKTAFLKGLEVVSEEAQRVHDIILQVASLIKNDGFATEQEWRLLSQAVPAALLHYDELDGMFVPYAPFDFADSLRTVTIRQSQATKAALGLRGFLSTKRHPQSISIALSKHALPNLSPKVIQLERESFPLGLHGGSEHFKYKPDVS